jgi:hypothetical protein
MQPGHDLGSRNSSWKSLEADTLVSLNTCSRKSMEAGVQWDQWGQRDLRICIIQTRRLCTGIWTSPMWNSPCVLVSLAAMLLSDDSRQTPKFLAFRITGLHSHISHLTFWDTHSYHAGSTLGFRNPDPWRHSVRSRGNQAEDSREISSWSCNKISCVLVH